MKHSDEEIYRIAFNAGLRPEPALTVSEWADKHRELPAKASAEPGRWRTSRTPYLREIMDNLSPSSPAKIIVFMKAAQIGATEAGNNWIGYIIDYAPGPAMMVLPTVEGAKRSSKQRIAPMIEATPRLREKVKDARTRDSGNTMLAKEYPSGILIMTGANSAVGLRSMPARYLFLDEVDAYESDIDGEGDPVELAIRRTATYRRNRKIFMPSTPTVKDVSRIETAFERSDKRYYNVPCPHCNEYQPIEWRNIKFDKEQPKTAILACEACGGMIEERHKTRMLENGRWITTAEGDGITTGYHLNALYSPLGWYSWGDAVADFLAAKAKGPEALKTWTNTVLGETWEEEGESVDETGLLGRREQYTSDELPAGVLVLVAAVDVQDDRLEMEVAGFGEGEESWGIEYRVMWGDPGQIDLWNDLNAALLKNYRHPTGIQIHIAATTIDSGGHYTQEVYDFCKTRQARRIFAIKGAGGEGRPIVSAPSKKLYGKNKRPVPLFTVGVDAAKSLVYSNLRISEPGPGYCHFPVAYTEEYFAQLTAEKIVTRYKKGFPHREWIKTRARNEALDIRAYMLAALRLLNPVWEVLKTQRIAMLEAQDKNLPAPNYGPRRRIRSKGIH